MNYFINLLKNIDKTLLILPLFFAAISVTMIGSTAYAQHFVFNRDMQIQLVAYILGIAAIIVILLFDYGIFKKFEKIFYIASIALLLCVYIPGLGSSQKGARGWLNFGPINLQPAELVKISFILMFAHFLCRHKEDLCTFKGIARCGLYAFPFLFLILIQPDLGNVLVFCVIAAVMIFSAGVDGKLYAKLLGGVAACMPIAYFLMEDHQKIRIDAFLNPSDTSLPGNYQVLQSKIAVGSGGFFGKGLFQGTQKELKFLPVQKSDFIFSVIVEELGMLGGGVVIGLYTLFLYRIMRIIDNAKDLYGALVVTGMFAMFTFQIFENIGMTMGLMPVTGITLPFISYGGSSIVTNMIALGLILNIGMRSKLINF